MTPLADMVEQMLARGIAPDVIVMAVRAAEICGHSTGIPVDTAAEKRRAWDRERKANKRNSTGHSTGLPPDHGSALPLLSSSTDSQKNPKEEKKARERGQKLPPDWKPNAGHFAVGLQLGFHETWVADQAEDMRLWARSNEHRAIARKSDWDLSFLGWVRREAKRGNNRGPPKSKSNGFLDLARNLEQACNDHNSEDSEDPGSSFERSLGRH